MSGKSVQQFIDKFNGVKVQAAQPVDGKFNTPAEWVENHCENPLFGTVVNKVLQLSTGKFSALAFDTTKKDGIGRFEYRQLTKMNGKNSISVSNSFNGTPDHICLVAEAFASFLNRHKTELSDNAKKALDNALNGYAEVLGYKINE